MWEQLKLVDRLDFMLINFVETTTYLLISQRSIFSAGKSV